MDKNRALLVLIVGYGGGEITFLNRLVKGLADAGHQVTVTSPKNTNPLLLKHPHVHKLKTPAWEGFILWRLFSIVGMFLTRFSFRRLGWLVKQVGQGTGARERWVVLNRYLPFLKGHWDVIYFPWNSAAIGYQGLYQLGIPVVVSCRGSQINIRPHLPGQEDYVAGLKKTLKQAAAVHCVSSDIEREALAYGLELHKSSVVRPAVDPDVFRPPEQRRQNKRFTLVTTGSLIWTKGYEYLLLAFKELVSQGVDAELHILGQGYMEQAIRFTLDDMGLGGRVHLQGRVTPDEVLAFLQQADAFVLSSLSEGISNAVLEAMSCGLPVVTTDCGGMREAVTDGVEGFVVSLRNPEAMAAAVKKLADDPDLRARMGAAGRKRILKDFCLDDQLAAFEDLFRSVVQDNEEE